MKEDDKNKDNLFYAVSLGLELGFLIAFPLAAMMVLGVFLDTKLATFPIFLIVCIVLGMVLTFLDVYFIVLPFINKRSESKDKDILEEKQNGHRKF